MPCPFPGMDPWLENADVWPDLHLALVAEIRSALQPSLRACGYYAKASERESAVGYVEICRQKDHQLVTVIEVVSPTQKSNSQERSLYRKKQNELRETGIHLVEIDLIRRGPIIVDVTVKDANRPLPWDYVTVVRRRGVSVVEIHPLRVRDRLRRCCVPLTSDHDDDVVLDLPVAFRKAYDSGPYPECLDYSQIPDPPLAGEDEAWARELLVQQGLLPA